MEPMADPGIVRVLIALGPDFTALEWAERLNVTLDEVLEATRASPYARVRPEIGPSKTTLRRVDQAALIVAAVQKGYCVAADIAAHTGINRQTVRAKLTLLATQGVLFRCGSGPKTRWFST